MNNYNEDPQLAEKVSQVHRYLIFIWGDVSAEMRGPYPTIEARDEAAQSIMREEGDEHGIHMLDVLTTGDEPVEVEVGDYSGAFFMDNEEGTEDEEDGLD